MRRAIFLIALCGLMAASTIAQSAAQLSPAVREFVKVDAPVVVLNHVRVIDGTGAAARADQAMVIQNGKIVAMGDAASVKIPDQAKVLDYANLYTVIPGLVGMHDHLHYTADRSPGPPGPLINQITFSAPR